MIDRTPDQQVFELVAYLVACARLALDEPVVYGSFRLVEGASRLIRAAEDLEGSEVDETLRTFRASIEREKMRMIEDHEGYRAWLDGLLADIATEATRRNLAHESHPR